jgi:ribonuclease J
MVPQRRIGQRPSHNRGGSHQRFRGSATRMRHGRSRPPKRKGPMRVKESRRLPHEKRVIIPPPPEGVIRVIPLGGVEEIGRNMTAIEIGEDIIVVDAGFGFGEATDTPGIDYVLPNSEYLEERRHKVRALVITHGHLDHIGGIPFVIDRIGNPPIYTRRLTGVMIKKRQEEFTHLPAPTIREVEGNESITIGNITVKFFAVTHTIPDSMGVIVETQYGDVVVTGDVKLNHTNGVPTEEEEREYGVFKDRKVLLLLMDSTNVDRPGWSIPEHTVHKTLEELITKIHGRIIIGTFASQLERLMKIILFAESHGRHIVVDGRSMKTNIEIVRELGILKNKDKTLVTVDHMHEYPSEKLIILATGAQGDEFASLMRIGNKTHKYITLTPNDTVILSSSVIPGNERAVQKLMDNLSRQGAHIITYQSSDVHASGHGYREEAKWIHNKIRPQFFMPQHGYHYKLRIHADLIQESINMPKENIAIPDNSSIIEVVDGGTKIVKRKEKAPDSLRVVEGQSISELSNVLMRDRKTLAGEGFCVVVATVDRRTGKLHKSPDIISRGFVYLRENRDLMDQTRLIIRKSVEYSLRPPKTRDLDRAREDLADAVANFLLQQTQKRPIVIPVIVSI